MHTSPVPAIAWDADTGGFVRREPSAGQRLTANQARQRRTSNEPVGVEVSAAEQRARVRGSLTALLGQALGQPIGRGVPLRVPAHLRRYVTP